MISTFYRDVSAVIFVYDVTSADSFLNIGNLWINELSNYSSSRDENPTLKFLLGNKNESYKKIVDSDTAQKFATENGMIFLEVSAKSSDNVSQFFPLLISELKQCNIVQQRHIRELNCHTLSPTHRRSKYLSNHSSSTSKNTQNIKSSWRDNACCKLM